MDFLLYIVLSYPQFRKLLLIYYTYFKIDTLPVNFIPKTFICQIDRKKHRLVAVPFSPLINKYIPFIFKVNTVEKSFF